MDKDQLPERMSQAVEGLPGRMTHAVEGLRDRAAGAVSADSRSLFREIGSVVRRIDTSEDRLVDRLDDVEDSLGSRIDALTAADKRTTWPRRLFWLLVGAGIGVAVQFLNDPDRGHARRTQLADQAAARARDVGGDLQTKAKMATDRARGQVVEGIKDKLPDHAEDDPKLLEQRIKSQVFGHRDDVQDVVLRIDAPGTVAIKGTVATTDTQRELLAQIAEVDGVVDVRSELTVRSS